MKDRRRHNPTNFLLNSFTFLVLGLAVATLVIFDQQTILANTAAFWRVLGL